MAGYPKRESRSGQLPVDLVAVALLGVWTAAVGIGQFSGGSLRFAIGVVAVLFAPGYALVSALFPDRRLESPFFGSIEHRSNGSDAVVTVLERVVLAVGLSVCMVPLIGLGLNYLPGGVHSSAFLKGVGITTVLLTGIAAARRYSLPPQQRFNPRFVGFTSDIVDHYHRGGSGAKLSLAFAAGLLLVALGIGFAATTAPQGEAFTELSLQTQEPETGNLVAAEYPDTLSESAETPLYIGVTNQEGRRVRYTIVGKLQKFSGSGEQRTVTAQNELLRESVSVAPGETKRYRHTVNREVPDGEYRLTYLLYVGDAPENPTVRNSYRQVHIWLGSDSSA